MAAFWQSILDLINPNTIIDADFGLFLTTVRELLSDPTSNPQMAMMSLAFVTLLLLIILLVVIIAILRFSEHETVVVKVAEPRQKAPSQQKALEEKLEELAWDQKRPVAGRFVTAAIGCAVLLALWMSVGYSSSLDSVCLGCHGNTPHALAVDDPHVNVSCVRCHESASRTQILITSVPKRFAHFYHGMREDKRDTYGSVANAGCLSCHGLDLEGSVTNRETGIRVSHTEPLDKGFACLDCHRIKDSTIRVTTRGMNVCIRCHNNESARADCRTCHTKDYAYALGTEKGGFRNFSARLVPNPGCTSCHNMERDCDPCHKGVRLPHSLDFLALGHAYVATQKIWNGTIDPTCINQCHSEQRRPCTACHQTTKFPAHGPGFRDVHKTYDPEVARCGCHSATPGIMPGRNFCLDVCHRPGTDALQLP